MPKQDEQSDPIGQYVEWAEHRYDPGHYLGGNSPPPLRKQALGPKARKKAAMLIGGIGLLSTGALATLASAGTFGKGAAGLLILLIAAAAWKMYRG
jgi:hypothetical protein